MTDASCTAEVAVRRAQGMVGVGGQYLLGTGDYGPVNSKGVLQTVTFDTPWTSRGDSNGPGSDCAGFAICWCWKLRRHRPGFNRGAWASVEDDINVNSIMEDAKHKQELAQVSVVTRPGDLLCYPTFYLKGVKRPFIGHVGIIESVPGDWVFGRWDRLTVIQCHGPDGFKPGVVRTDGSAWLKHDMDWPKDIHRTEVVRMRERP